MKTILPLLFILLSFGVQSTAFSDPDKRQEKREERGRSDERQDKTRETVVKKKELLARTSETASKKRSVMAFAENRVSVWVMEIKIIELKQN